MSNSANFDVVVVGSGINSLVCAALLAKRARRVCVLEREATLGGCIRTEELTQPGFRHDTLSTLYPLFVTAPYFPQLKDELARYGATFCNCATPTGVLLPRGAVVFHSDRNRNIATLDAVSPGDGAAYARAMQDIEEHSNLTFGLLGSQLWTAATLRLLVREMWHRGPQSLCQYFGDSLQSCRTWLEREFRSEQARALFAPWVLHVGLGPESALSALMAKLVMFTLEAAGSPMIVGGSAGLVHAFARLIQAEGGVLHTGADVSRVIVSEGVACGVRTADGRTFTAKRAVVCNVTPVQLYQRLLAPEEVPPEFVRRSRAYRPGRGEMQIHLALDEAPQWLDPRLADVAMLHVTPGLDGVSRAVNEAVRGLLPHEATIVVAQPTAVDPSRAPRGKSTLWIQLQELPTRIRGDADGDIQCPPDGTWTEEIRERYADRIIGRLCQYIPNLRRVILGRKVLSPADLEKLNVNLIAGDPYSGACELDQFMLWRPFAGERNHCAPVRRLFRIGASSHPGPGLGGMSGFMAATRIS